MRKLFICVGLILVSGPLFSQLTHSVSIGPDLGIPTPSLGKANIGFGGSLQYQIKFSPPLALQLHVGYISFTNKLYADDKVTFLPVRLGGVYYLYQDIIFVSADAGISHYYSPSTGTKQNGFTLGTGIGYRYPISNSQFVQVSGYYNLHNFKRAQSSQDYNYNWFNVRAAYGLSCGKGKREKK
jgi:Outer membrane protein beta-barrel domain